jgi:hypothetical protein
MSKVSISLRENPDMQERFIEGAFAENPNIDDFPSFVDAGCKYLGTPKGQNALQFMDDEDWKLMFETDKTKSLIKPNISEKRYSEMFKKTDGEVFGDAPYEVQRRVEKGEKTKPSDLKVFETGKLIKVNKYTRYGKFVEGYARTIRKWQPIEENFLINMKKKKVSPKEVILRYNKMFNAKPRTISSISTKYQRLK